MGIGNSQCLQIPDVIIPTIENTGESLIQNLTLNLSKHLRNVREDASRVTCFIETVWLPQRRCSVREIRFLIKTHEEKNITLKKIQISSKSISAAGKLAAVVTIPFPPLACFTLALSVGADVVSESVSIAKAKNVNNTAAKTESTLLLDRERTLQLHEILTGYNLLLKDVDVAIKKFHKATFDGSFDKVRASPSVEKFLNKVRSINTQNPHSTSEILNALKELITDAETYSDLYDSMCDLMEMNPDVKICMIEGAEIFASTLCLTVLANTTKIAGRAICGAFTFLLFLKDCNDIGNMISSLENGTDETTFDLKNVLRELEEEMRCLEKAVDDVRKRSSL